MLEQSGAFCFSRIDKVSMKHESDFSKYGWLVEVLKLIDERPRVRTFCYAVLFVVAIGVVLYTGAMFVEAMAKVFA